MTQAKHQRPPAKVRMVPAHERSTDFGDARFTMKAVIGIVAFTASIIGSQWAFSANLKTSITELGVRMDAKEVIDARDALANERIAAGERRLLDEWKTSMEKKIEQLEREYKLGDYDLKALITNKR